ncbi:MAG: outer membrane protein transport protein [Thermodesulfobacteriota bacterium]
MKKRISVLALAGVFAAGSAMASAYRIPEQSVNSLALAGADVAAAHGADAAYFNPANMSWEESKELWHVEADLMYIHLADTQYDSASPVPGASAPTLSEQFVFPLFHLVSPEYYGSLRYGISFTVPGGLSKRWDNWYQAASAQEFTLEILELSPSFSWRASDKLSIGGGIRLIYSEGVVRSSANAAYLAGTPYGPLGLTDLNRNLEGDTMEFGYNLAISVRPTEELNLAATYRSNVDLDLEGDATLTAIGGPLAASYTGAGAVSVPLPAVLTLATSYDFGATTVELTWDRTFWSEYEDLDFNYDQTFGPTSAFYNFDRSIAKNWDDSDAYRIGVSHQVNDVLTVMAGFAIDDTPIPDATLSFELPDSKAKIYSVGGRYKLGGTMEVGLAYLYDDKESRTVNNGHVNGTFSDAQAHLFTAGLSMTF